MDARYLIACRGGLKGGESSASVEEPAQLVGVQRPAVVQPAAFFPPARGLATDQLRVGAVLPHAGLQLVQTPLDLVVLVTDTQTNTHAVNSQPRTPDQGLF